MWVVRGALAANLLAFVLISASPLSIEVRGSGGVSNQPGTTQKGEEGIKCPAGTVRAEVTTPLPSPWWQTPQEGRLVGTRVATIAGRRTLVCEYSAYGTRVAVMREFPSEAAECRAIRGGFLCR
jgi:hypothetical protein